jgi:hypothetical protein
MGAHWIPSDEAASLRPLRDRLASEGFTPTFRAGSSTSVGPRAAPRRDRVASSPGFFCRCQTKRFAGFRPPHPVEAVLAHLEGSLG